jgi:hypothetical protein
MLESFNRFFANQGLGADFSEVSGWAKRQGHAYKRARDVEGFAIDGKLEKRSWRVEWGPPQRPWITGNELRARIELDLPGDLQMLLLSKPLMEALEKQTFEQFTQTNTTELGESTPEEMRWLVMFPKIEMRGMKTLRSHFGGVSSLPGDGPAWLEGALGAALLKASRRLLLYEPPFVLMTLRGRAYLRLQLATADADDVAEAVELFEVAATQALRVATNRHEPRQDFTQTVTSAWQSLLPGRRDKPKS